MNLYHENSPDAQPSVGDKHWINGVFYQIKELPTVPGQPLIVSRIGGNFQDYDFYPEAVGLVWR